MPRKPLTLNEKLLTRRYLVWCYKTTKESLDRIDRYYTQLTVDDFVLKELRKVKISQKGVRPGYESAVSGFEKYMNTKKENVDQKKFSDASRGIPSTDYVYLQNRLKALEKAIVRFLGKKGLKDIWQMYENKMTLRILQAREHA